MKKNPSEKCPVCGQYNSRLIRMFPSSWDYLLLDHLRQQNPGWEASEGVCNRCLDQFQTAYLSQAASSFRGDGSPGEISGYQVLPVPFRLLAHPDFTGKGVTICFIDSSFFPHPDLVYPRRRIKKILDITSPRNKVEYFEQIKPESWHGAMTSVVAAGSGYLSGGNYRGIASNAELILVKVYHEEEGIEGKYIAAALRWVLENRKRYGIRIVNLSVADSWPVPTSQSSVNQAVEELTAAGVVVVAAAGNDPSAPVAPPASAPSALTVGGLDDRNTLDPVADVLYPSSFGRTADSMWKPELVAPSIWIAAPILPGAPQQEEAAALFALWKADEWHIRAVLAGNLDKVKLSPELLQREPQEIREAVGARIREEKYISPHYKHVDGTSFAAPIVSSVVAQMLEANPRLDVSTVRELLLSTARPLPNGEIHRQGYGVVQPLWAVNRAAGEKRFHLPALNPRIDYRREQVIFHYRDPQAESVSISGLFNNWIKPGLPMQSGGEGRWTARLPLALFRPGIYPYKLIVDDEWKLDPRNPYRDPDGHGGFNNKFVVEGGDS